MHNHTFGEMTGDALAQLHHAFPPREVQPEVQTGKIPPRQPVEALAAGAARWEALQLRHLLYAACAERDALRREVAQLRLVNANLTQSLGLARKQADEDRWELDRLRRTAARLLVLAGTGGQG